MPYEEREHTADILMHVWAQDIPTLFEECGHALMAVMYQGSARPDCTYSFTVTGIDHEQILQAFLSELLCLTETENVVFSEIAVSLNEGGLTARLSGEPFDRKIHGGGSEVKGISFSGLSISRQNDEYVLDILFDV
ncbi:archease [Methanospirillum lacunae]|uniref:Protein archease n=1 Tax=Methanospirillum lacunae TaxID=668570 RepID=A0A2V2MT13_9EURY|nr:archease [Methanospirillum lacunae]PWR70549.1 protein archease [Methanospirillum lacunae]